MGNLLVTVGVCALALVGSSGCGAATSADAEGAARPQVPDRPAASGQVPDKPASSTPVAAALDDGASTTFGLVAQSQAEGLRLPTSCSVAGAVCVITEAPAPAPSSSAAPTGSAPHPVPPAPPAVPLPADFGVAPYVDMVNWPTPDLSTAQAGSGISTYSLAFFTSAGGCTPAWGGIPSLGLGATGSQIDTMNASIANLRAGGGDVVMSFGGAAGSELALTCKDPKALQSAYQAVIDAYALTRIDFDIEGAAQSDRAANVRRGQAIAGLQSDAAAAGRQLTVTFTLPVTPKGLVADGLNTLNDTITGGGRVDLVNVMTMNYGGENSAMGQSAIDAATHTAKQLTNLFPAMTDAERLARVGITPMIGENDVPKEVFTTADATMVGSWARANKVGLVSWWSVARDKPCPTPGTRLDDNCSGTPNPAWAYARAFTAG